MAQLEFNVMLCKRELIAIDVLKYMKMQCYPSTVHVPRPNSSNMISELLVDFFSISAVS